jgi:Magnesium chelatase, subunit ChlI
MLARRLTTILPAMTLAEAIETTRIHRVAGLTGDRRALVTTRPFRGGLYYAIVMHTGNGSDDEAVRGWIGDDRESLSIMLCGEARASHNPLADSNRVANATSWIKSTMCAP